MMSTKFIQDGSTVRVVKMNTDTVSDKLPAKIYSLSLHPMLGYYLNIEKDKLKVPDKIYGKATARVDKCLTTYNSRSASTGILMTGDKGTGKTLLMSLLANEALERLGLPVILIKEPHHGESFMSFIESIGECCLVFDEFGKMYSNNSRDGEVDQNTLLSLLDGVDKTKRLIIMTENSEFAISEFMLNRPSRIYYHFKYKKLDECSIEEYCNHKEIVEETKTEILEMSRRAKFFSFDMLQSLVEEHLRFKEPIADIIDDLNINSDSTTVETIEILKVIYKETNEEIPVEGLSVMDRPVNKWGKIKLKSRPDIAEKDLEYYDDDDIKISIKDRHLLYETATNLVYDAEEYTVVAKVISSSNVEYGYNKFF